MNAGKRFEADWRDSIPADVYYHRLNDPAQSFAPGANTRFSLDNPFDCMMYRYPTLFTLELKTTKGTSFTFWRSDFGKGTYMIKKVQILGLTEAARYTGVVAGLLLNFREKQHTYFLDIESFAEYTKTLPKKSINEQDVIAAGGLLIGQRLLKVNSRYDVEGFIHVTAGAAVER